MPDFDNEFETVTPKGDSLANSIDVFINADTKKAINERIALEHNDMVTGGDDTNSQNAQGRHLAGMVGSLGMGTAAERNALSAGGVNPGHGAMWVSTEEITSDPIGTWYRYDHSAGWVALQAQVALYADAAEVEAGTETAKAISPETLRQADTEYQPLTTPITVSPVTIAALVGPNVDPENVRGLCIHVSLDDTIFGFSNVTASYPGTAEKVLGSIVGSAISVTSEQVIPVNQDTVTVTLTRLGGGSFSIHGVMQRTYDEVI